MNLAMDQILSELSTEVACHAKRKISKSATNNTKRQKFTENRKTEPGGGKGASKETITTPSMDSVGATAMNPMPSWDKPTLRPVSLSCLPNIVFFDLETTSLATDCDITQIAAVHENEVFNQYVIPRQEIHFMASMVTGLTCNHGVLSLNGKVLDDAVSQKIALEKFLGWIEVRSPVLLFAHNAKFDYVRFFHAIQQQNLAESFQKHIEGFVDTVGLFKEKFPGLHNYKQETLVRTILKKSYDNHNAEGDAKTLQELYKRTQPHSFQSHSCTYTSAFKLWLYRTNGKENMKTFRNIIRCRIMSQKMATKMAQSGLCMKDLQNACQKSGEDGLLELLSEADQHGKPRVTKVKKIVNKIFAFIQNL